MTINQIFALAVITLFYASYLQRQFVLRRHGIRTNRLGKGQKECKTRVLEIVLLVVSFSMPVAQYGSILAGWGCAVTPEWLGWAGIAVAFIGVLFFLFAVVAMRENWRAGIDASQNTELVTRGVYRLSRNPAFVGFDLLYIGMAAAFPNPVLIALTAIGVVVFHLQILEEERFMTSVFGTAYTGYARKTRRYL